MHVLHVLQGPDAGARFALPDNEPQLIGRSSEALPIADHAVSRRHAELTPDGGRWYVRDLDSANGTYINGHAIDGRVELHPGDDLRVGSTVLRLASEPDPPTDSPIRLLGPEEMDHAVSDRVGPDDLLGPLGPLIKPAAIADRRDDDPLGETHEGLRLASEHLRVIYELSALTATAVTADELLPRVLELVFREFSAQRGFVLLRPEGTTRLEAAAVRYRERPRTRDEGRIPVSRTIVDHVLANAEGILATNAMNDARFRAGDSVREYGIRTAICVPVRGGRTVMGVIHIDSSIADFSWSEPELRLMTHIGQHVGLALEGIQSVAAMMRRERLAAMGETVASLSHSIKNILQGLRGGADAVELALRRDDVAAAREGWPIVSRNLDRILSLTLNMLAWGKPRALDIELVAVAPLLREVAELMQPRCAQRGVAITVGCDDSMPPVPMDANAMHQALMNLVANAVDEVRERTGRIELRARHLPQRDAVELSVVDNGGGVAPEVRDRIFEPFVTTKGQRGTGLGLAVTRQIAEEHGGAIGVQSEPGKGSVFTIVLPLTLPEQEKGKTHAPRPGLDTLEERLE